MISYNDFEKVDIRTGIILDVLDFPEARKPAYKLTIDFGSEIGVKRSSAQITQNYTKDELVGTLVLGIVNFPPKQIGPFISESLTLGVKDSLGNVVLVRPDKDAKIGERLY
jgi:tRNA-binding protein